MDTPSASARWAALACALALVLHLALPAAAGEERLVRVGYLPQAGFLSGDGEGRYSGYCYDYLEEVAPLAGWRYEFVPGEWETCLERLEAGEIDLVCNVYRTPERMDRFSFSRYDAGTEYCGFYVRGDRDDIYYEDYASFDGLRVGLLAGSAQVGILEEYAREKGFNFDPAVYRELSAMREALRTGDVDAIVTGSLRRSDGEKLVAKFSPSPLYFAAGKGGRALMDTLDGAMEQLSLRQPDFTGRLYEKYRALFAADGAAFTRAEAAYVRENPVLRVAYDPDWAPIEEVDASGNASGICADMIALVFERCGLRLEVVRTQSYAQSVAFVRAGRADVVCDYLWDSAFAREDGMAVTQSYFDLPVVFAAYENGEAVLDTGRMGVTNNFRGVRSLLATEYPEARLTSYPTAEELFRALDEGEIDFAVESTYVFEDLLRRGQLTGVTPAARRDFPVCMGVSREAPRELVGVLDKGVSRLGKHERDAVVFRNTVDFIRDGELLAMVRAWAPELMALLLLLFAVIVAFILYLARRSQRMLSAYAFTDALTGGRNWNRFELDARRLLARPGAAEQSALLKLDIDRFKLINDRQGFDTGDRILRYIASELGRSMGPGEIFCRIADDNFAALLHYDDAGELEARVKKLAVALSGATVARERHLRYTISCGVYRFIGGEEPRVALDRAELAKGGVKGLHVSDAAVFSDEMRERILWEGEIENRMEDALAAREFTVYYQPKVALASGRVTGAEALVRWQSPELGLVGPDKFIGVFENNGFIVRLDLYVFEEVCRTLRRWLDEGREPVPVSVNLSRVHLYDETFYRDYVSLCERYRIPAELVELELTETTIFDSQETLVELLGTLHRLGFRLSMDDFGSGYSSLNLLRNMPIDVLKLDREFLGDASNTERGRTIIECVVDMASRLSIEVLSEGVETRQQAQFLRAAGCDTAQGYYFSRPLAREDFEAFLTVENKGKVGAGNGGTCRN